MDTSDKDDRFSKLKNELLLAYDVIKQLNKMCEEKQLALESALRIVMRLMQIANVESAVTFTDAELFELDLTHKLFISHFDDCDSPQLTLTLREKATTKPVIEFVNAENTEYAKKLTQKSQLN